MTHCAEAKTRSGCGVQLMCRNISISSFLATGDSYTGLSARFRLGKKTVHEIINDTCKAIWTVLQPEVMPKPTRNDWIKIERGFRLRWHFPNCIGALDGKHMAIISPPASGSLFYNYKGYYSLVLMALVDANYRFVYVNIGEYGSNSDSNVFQFSKFGQKFMNEKLNIPGNKRLSNYNDEGPMPHVIVADEGFPLLHNLMRPFPRCRESTLPKQEAIFNFHLSHARMCVENAFGILVQRWRIFNRRIPLSVDNADNVIKAACCLHNYLTEDKNYENICAELNPRGRQCMDDRGVICMYLPRLHGYRSRDDAQAVRNLFKTYFNSPQGSVTWQEARISYQNA